MSPTYAAVIGAGPSGLYAVHALLEADPAIRIDVFEALPTPLGLLRYGVAPDHLKIKALAPSLEAALAHPRVRLAGNVRVGRDVSVETLRTHYDIVVHAFGAERSRRLGVPGEQMHGSVAAADLISWYSGKPGAAAPRLPARVRTAVVIGAGNVALDVARFLARRAEDLRATDVPSAVLSWLADAGIEDLHLVVRRSPAEVKFSSKELRELVSLPGAHTLVHGVELPEDGMVPPHLRRTVRVLRDAVTTGTPTGGLRLHFHFGTRPVEVLGNGKVERIRLAGPAGLQEFDAQLLISAIGYLGTDVPDVPMSSSSAVAAQGPRVVRDGSVSPGEYVTGWARRGATGVLATNRADGEAVAAAVIEDAGGLISRRTSSPDALLNRLRARRIVVDAEGWARIQAAEQDEGRLLGRDRVKIADPRRLLAAASAADSLTREVAS